LSRDDVIVGGKTRNTNLCASFNTSGDRIYVGSNSGTVTVYRVDTLQRISSFYISTEKSGLPPAIKGFAFSQNGKQFLVNSSDKFIRLYNSSDNSVVHELCDRVVMVQWNCFSFAGEDFIIAASSDKGEHKIYVWNREFGGLAKILEGPTDIILDIAWHPNRNVLACGTCSGSLYIWTKPSTESWSAYAPGFTELEENQEYIEKENEFDMVEEMRQQKQEIIEEEFVDIETSPSEIEEILSDPVIPTHPFPDFVYQPTALTNLATLITTAPTKRKATDIASLRKKRKT